MAPPVPTRPSFFSPELTLALGVEKMCALFAAHEATPPRTRQPLAFARALWARALPWPLADALDELTLLATRAGHDALVEAARDRLQEPDGWEDEPPVQLAARLLEKPVDTHAVRIRAHQRLARLLPERPTYALRGAAARKIEGAAEARRALAAALAGAAGGPWSDAWVHEDDDGVLHAVLLYAVPAEVDCHVPPAARGPNARAVRRALRADAFCFHVSEAHLAVTTARPQKLEAYGEAWGRALYGEGRFFAPAPSITLKPLQALGPAGLASAALPGGIVRARVIACQLDTGDADRLEARGPRALAKLGPHLRAGGHLTRATVRFDIIGELRPVDVVLALPNRVDIGAGGVGAWGSRAPGLARRAIAALGLLSPGAMADDVTTLLPLVHPEWRWRELAGGEGLSAMRAAGLLEPVAGEETRRPAIERMRAYGRNAIAYALFRTSPGSGGPPDPGAPRHVKDLVHAMNDVEQVLKKVTGYYAVPEDWAFRAQTLQLEEMAMWRLALDAVVRKGRRELGLERGERPRLPKGVLWVGEMRVESGAVRWFYVVRPALEDRDRAALGKAIARATGFGKAVVLVPKGRKLGRDFVELELGVKEQLGAASWRGKMAEAVQELGLEEEVSAERTVRDDVRVVIDTKRELVLLDGVPLLKMGESGYRLVKALAARGEGAIVPGKETDRAISGARLTDGATRNAAWKMKTWVRESFEMAGKKVPHDVEGAGLVRVVGKKGWTLAVKGVLR